jgi:CRISPR-associated protein Csd2
MSKPITNRIDFLLLFDVKDGNPNGDPDFDNSPRFDPETFQGLVSDVCIKRKIRDWVYAAKSQDGAIEPGYDIFVLQGHSLESRQKMPYEHLKMTPPTGLPEEEQEQSGDEKAAGEKSKKGKGGKKKTTEDDLEKIVVARDWMCKNFFDVRAFGAVMSTTAFKCGQVRGPVQITFSRSYHRILSTDHRVQRVCKTKETDHIASGQAAEIGRKHTVAYGLYAAHGFVTPAFAGGRNGTGFNSADLKVLKKALVNMFDLDHSAARGLMRTRHIFAFEHTSAMGQAPSGKLFDLVTVSLREGVESPRAFEDYVVRPLEDIRVVCPEGVTVKDWANE